MTFVRAVTDLDFYREAINHPAGRVVGYVALLVLIASALTVAGSYRYSRTLGSYLHELAGTMPPFVLSGGRLQVDGAEPVILTETPEVLVVVDTSGRVPEDVLGQRPAGVWIGEHKMVLKGEAGYVTLRFSDLGPVTMDNGHLELAAAWYPALTGIMAVVYFLVCIPLKLLGTLVLAIFGLIPNASMRRGLPFGGMWRISAYAVTAPTLLMGAATLADVAIPRPLLVYWTIAVIYVWMALRRLAPVPAR